MSLRSGGRRPVIDQAGKPWSDHEIDILKKNRHLTTKSLASLLPNRTCTSINNKRYRSGFSRVGPNWTDKEVETLRRLLKTGHTYKQAAEHLPGRSLGSIREKVAKLNLTIPKPEFVTTGNDAIDSIRQRAREDGISLVALDRELGMGRYFSTNVASMIKKGFQPSIGRIAKAVNFFGGEVTIKSDGKLIIDWKDV